MGIYERINFSSKRVKPCKTHVIHLFRGVVLRFTDARRFPLKQNITDILFTVIINVSQSFSNIFIAGSKKSEKLTKSNWEADGKEPVEPPVADRSHYNDQ